MHFCRKLVFLFAGNPNTPPSNGNATQNAHPCTEMASRRVLELPMGSIWHAISVQGCTLRNAFLRKRYPLQACEMCLGTIMCHHLEPRLHRSPDQGVDQQTMIPDTESSCPGQQDMFWKTLPALDRRVGVPDGCGVLFLPNGMRCASYF